MAEEESSLVRAIHPPSAIDMFVWDIYLNEFTASSSSKQKQLLHVFPRGGMVDTSVIRIVTWRKTCVNGVFSF